MSYEDDIAAAKRSGLMYRTTADVQTGDRAVVFLTAEEIAAREEEHAAQDAYNQQQQAKRAAEQSRRDVLSQLAEKIEADPSILERIK
jgi:hypothetical protein